MRELPIRNALIDAVEAMTLSVTLPIKYPNMAFTIPNDGKYIELLRFSNGDVSFGWGNEAAMTRGILRVAVVWPEDTGESDAIGLQREIADCFPKGLKLFYTGGNITIYDFPAVGTMLKDGQRAVYPVTIRYQEI